MTRWACAPALLVLVRAGCGDGSDTACPALYLPAHPNVVVQLDEGWPAGAADRVVLRCDPECTEGGDELTEVLDDGTAYPDVTADPDSVVVTVLDRSGRQLTELTTELEFVDGYGPGCGGPPRATVTVPPP